MNARTAQLRSVSTGMGAPARDQWRTREHPRTHEVVSSEQAKSSVASLLLGIIASVAYAAVSSLVAAGSVLIAIVAAPWILLAPALLAGLVIMTAGFVLSGFGLL